MPDSVLAELCDFERSFIRWGIDTEDEHTLPLTVSHKPPFTLNLVRVSADSFAAVTDKATGETREYLLGSSCKTEYVNVQEGVWMDPNADLTPIGGSEQIMNFKRWDRCGKDVMRYPESLGIQEEKQIETGKEVFCLYGIEVRRRRHRRVDDLDDLIACFESGEPTTCRTRVSGEHFELVLEYPISVVNFSPRDQYYQVDTGPVLLPDLSCKTEEVLPTFNLAYIAHNGGSWAEFIVCRPTALRDDLKVYHYSETVRVTCENEAFVVLS